MAKKWREKRRGEIQAKSPSKDSFEWVGTKGSGNKADWIRPLPAAYELPQGITLHPGGGISLFGPTYFYLCISQKTGFPSSTRSSSVGKSTRAYKSSGPPPESVTEYSEWVRFAGQFDWSEIRRRLDRYHPEGWENKPHGCVAIRLCRWEETPYHHLLLPDRFLSPRGGEKPKFVPECMKEYFSDILGDTCQHLNSKVMDTAEYLRILQDLSSLTQRVADSKTVGSDDLQALNEMKTRLKRNPTNIHDFLAEFWESLTQELCQNRIAGRCDHCGALMRFRSNKRYCTLKQENRDCGKAARNRRYQARLKKPS